jgi:hypothetical protein
MAGGLAVIAILAVASKFACGAAPAPDRFAISPGRVSSALQQAGILAKSSQVEFLSAVTSMAENPQLTVVNVSRWRDGDSKALLRCRNNRECLPFYVVLHDNKATGRISANFVNSPQSKPNAGLKPRQQSAEKPLVRGGQRATLIIKNRDLRISLPVICLENGKRGETIRLSSPDRKQKYTGEVVEAGLLQGNF